MDDVSPELFIDTVTSYQKTAAILAALDLGLFTAIAEGASTPAALGERVGAAERGVRILADYLTILGFMTKTDGAYKLTRSSAVFLDRRSPAYMGSIQHFLVSAELRELTFEDPAGVVRAGGSIGLANIAPDNPVWVKFAQAMVPLISPTARAVAAHVAASPSHPRKVLDIAAGHGMFGISVLTAVPDAVATALDWSGVLAVASANAEKLGVADRFRTIVGSAFEADWGGGYDLVLLPNFLHHFDPDTCATLLKKAHDAVAPAGRVFVVEFVPNDDRISPPGAAKFSLTMLFTTPRGDAYTAAELDTMGRQAGFRGITSTPLPPGQQTLVEFLV
jgi:ubiquinone/menaquinone biosynthesis C-methylase UbiE